MAAPREKGPSNGLPSGQAQGSMTVRSRGGTTMARTKTKARSKVRARAKAVPVKRSAPVSRRKSSARKPDFVVNARRKHDFVVKHFRPEDFKRDGLRDYAYYRDLGIKDATHGMAVAHVIKLVGPCNPKAVSKLHTHEADFQMIYVLKGSLTGEYAGEVHTVKAGDCWLQPKNIEHKVIDYSDDCELLEIVMPADFKTVELEK
jgi:mannose-6-phosphate isomerase-like protein (cupin superfamily)